MADTNQELYEKLQKYLQLKKELEQAIKNSENWIREARDEKNETELGVAQWSLERNQLILEAVELAISDITTFLNDRWAEIREGDL
jgi:hypothetical protein